MTTHRCLIVLGMHRSGTSALAGVLSRLGVDGGPSLMPADAAINPKGYFEHNDIVDVHEQLLEALGSSWDDCFPLPDRWWQSSVGEMFRLTLLAVLRRHFRSSASWFIKDPRLCRLLPLWLDMLPHLQCTPNFLLALRDPGNVARSLAKRDGLSIPAGCLLWLGHMLEAEHLTRGFSRTVVSYDDLLTQPSQTIAAIERQLDLSWPTSAASTEAIIGDFLDVSLWHHREPGPLPDHPACVLARRVYDALTRDDIDIAQLDMLRAEWASLIALLRPLTRQVLAQARENRGLKSEVARLRTEDALVVRELRRIKSTFSWTITKPLRLIAYVWRQTCQYVRRN